MEKEFFEIYNIIGDWSKITFPETASKDHAKILIEEAKEIIDDPMDISKYADVFIALVSAAAKANIMPKIFMLAVSQKMRVNLKSEWHFDENNLYKRKI